MVDSTGLVSRQETRVGSNPTSSTVSKSSTSKERFFLGLVNRSLLKVTKSGKVFNTKTGREIASRCPSGRYRIVSYLDPESRIIYKIQVHRLVWITFKGIPNDPSLEVNHKDCDKSNCRLSNLELDTGTHNQQHARQNGLIYVLRGDDRPNAVFTDDQVITYRKLFSKERISVVQIATKHNCHRLTVRQMLKRKTYTHL